MRAVWIIAAISLAFMASAAAEDSEGSYVYLGAQSGGKSATAVFVNNFNFARSGDKVSAATLWVTYPAYPKSDQDLAYIVKNDIYYCGVAKISHQRVRSYNRYGHLLGDGAENSNLASMPNGNTLAGLVAKKICSSGSTVPGAENDVRTTVSAASLVLILSAPKTGKYAFPRPPQPPTLGYYPLGIAPPDRIPAPPSGAYRIPSNGQDGHIIDVYRAADGHLVFYYFRNDGKSDFYDTQAGRALFPGQERAMANSPGGWLAEKLRPPGLLKLQSEMVTFTRPKEKSVRMNNEGGRYCHPPYAGPMTISIDGAPERRFIFLKRRKAPIRRSSPDRPDLRIGYDELSLNIMAADDQGFFAHSYDLLALIHFDWNGHSPFFAGQQEVIGVPYEELRRVLDSGLADETDCPDQAAIDRAEALISRYGRLQMKRVSPLSFVH